MRRLVWVAIMMAGTIYALGQNKSMRDEAMDSALTSHKLIYFGKGEEPPRDSVSHLISKFYETQVARCRYVPLPMTRAYGADLR